MKLPNTIISLIFNEIKEKEWSELYFLFIDEIEWKINHLNNINNDKELKEKCKNENIFTILKNKNNNLNWNDGLFEACRGGHLNIVNLMIEKGADNWNHGLRGACQNGHLNIINYMIDKGAYSWNYGLYGACLGGHLNIVNLMIEKGADAWNDGLQGACQNGNLNRLQGARKPYNTNIMNLMIKKGATRCFYCYKNINDHLIKISINKNKNL